MGHTDQIPTQSATSQQHRCSIVLDARKLSLPTVVFNIFRVVRSLTRHMIIEFLKKKKLARVIVNPGHRLQDDRSIELTSLRERTLSQRKKSTTPLLALMIGILASQRAERMDVDVPCARGETARTESGRWREAGSRGGICAAPNHGRANRFVNAWSQRLTGGTWRMQRGRSRARTDFLGIGAMMLVGRLFICVCVFFNV
jgi:hypothetical protein